MLRSYDEFLAREQRLVLLADSIGWKKLFPIAGSTRWLNDTHLN